MAYLSKEAVAYRFKWNILKKIQAPLAAYQKKLLWVGYLQILFDDREISEYQSVTWTYPEKYLGKL